MKFHVVLSQGDSPERPARLTLAEGEEIDRLVHVSSTDDPQEVYAILEVLNRGGVAPHPRIERDWGAELRRLYTVAAAARGQAMVERQAGALGQRLHGSALLPPTGAEGAGPDKPA